MCVHNILFMGLMMTQQAHGLFEGAAGIGEGCVFLLQLAILALVHHDLCLEIGDEVLAVVAELL